MSTPAVPPSSVVELTRRLDAALPQTQCTRCGYPDCLHYAQAIAQGQARINQCPPGGEEGVGRLARITGQMPVPLNPRHGHEGPRHVAVIDESWCIGCTLCLDACPVDSIVGASKCMHTVIASSCTGCELCIPVCPVDCISLDSATPGRSGWDAWSGEQARQARERYARRQQRTGQTPIDSPASAPGDEAQDRKQRIIEAAMTRAGQRRLPP